MISDISVEEGISSSEGIQEGAIVVYEQDGHGIVGVVIAAHAKKPRVLTMRGREVDIAGARLDRVPGALPGDRSTAEQRAEFLLSLYDRASEAAGGVPIEELWSFVAEEDREFSLGELVPLYYGEQFSPEEHLTLRFALYRDPLYFRRKKYGFTPRRPETVEELRRAQEAQLEKEQQFATAREELLQIREAVENKTTSRSELRSTLSAPTAALLSTLERLAAAALDIEQGTKKEAERFLDSIAESGCEALSKVPTRGNLELRALALLEALHWIHRNTNLAPLRYGNGQPFSAELSSAAEDLAAEGLPGDERTREDLKGIPSVTIDDTSTQDMDDALSVTRREGNLEVAIHIADVASLVAIDSPLDREARHRATSLYFPEGDLHMFPKAISQELCSLQPKKTRATVSGIFTFSPLHELLHSRFALTEIVVEEKLSYEGVDPLLDPPSGDLGTLYEIAMSYSSSRMSRGGVTIPNRRARIHLTDPEHLEASAVEISDFDERTPARELVGEMMILMNEEAARFAHEHGIPFIYRSQEPSDPNVVEKRLEGIPPGPAYDATLRTTLKRSVTNTTAAPHATLGLSCYAQVTSPIRRYADLVNQRQLVAFLSDEPLPYTEDSLTALLHEISEPLHRARMSSRETTRFWLLRYLERRAKEGTPLLGTVLRTDGPQYQVELDEVYLITLAKSKEQLSVGTRVEVVLQKVDARNNTLKVQISRQ
ncbi:ribonuclease catalytic domain-containing protein [bacterium]|nr:ribonuclease catalytic domain-containing protein [bacterium]